MYPNKKPPKNAAASKPNSIITGADEKIKRNTKCRFNPVIPSILSMEICLIKRKTYIGMITIYDDATFVDTGKRWKDLIKLEHSSLFELFQSLYEQRRAA